MSRADGRRNERACKECLAELPPPVGEHRAIRGLRPAPHPGPRCYTHHLAWKKASKQRAHRKRTEANFGLGEGGYDALLKIQQGRCGGCGVLPGPRAKRLAVDHDHTCCPGPVSCGRCVRGLLCHGCNDDLARVRDDPSKLRGLAEYLEHWPSRDLGLLVAEGVYETAPQSEAQFIRYGESASDGGDRWP